MKQLTQRFALSAIVLALSSASVFAATSTPTTPMTSGIEQANIDKSVRTQDDFYRHVNGTWLKNTDIPADKSRWGSFNVLADNVVTQLHDIMEKLAADPASASNPDLWIRRP